MKNYKPAMSLSNSATVTAGEVLNAILVALLIATDAFMACFESVTRAIECSIAVQRQLDEHNRDSAHPTVHVRIGIAAGEPITEDDDLYGTTVNLAARICDAAEVGSVFVSNVVKELTIGKQFQFEQARELALKGFTEPVSVSKVIVA